MRERYWRREKVVEFGFNFEHKKEKKSEIEKDRLNSALSLNSKQRQRDWIREKENKCWICIFESKKNKRKIEYRFVFELRQKKKGVESGFIFEPRTPPLNAHA